MQYSDALRSQGRILYQWKTKNGDFFQNGSLKNFILSSMCLFLGQTKRPLGSGRYCLMYMATLVVARRGHPLVVTS